MTLSAFGDKSKPPTSAQLEKMLGKSAVLWNELVEHVTSTYPPGRGEWHFSSARFGWSLRLKQDDRILLYMTPQSGAFLAGLSLGEKAAAAARQGGASESVLALIDAAPRYAEGRGIRTDRGRFQTEAPPVV